MVLAHWFLPHMVPAVLAPDAGFQQAAARKANRRTLMSQQTQDHGPEYRHIDDMEWETLRFPGQHSKMVFHPRPERPSEPNTGFVRHLPGSFHPRPRHDFAQVWYILEGTFKTG